MNPGDVIQLDADNPRFAYCFATVTEVRGWGVVALVRVPRVPNAGDAFLRVETAHFVHIGRAAWAPEGA